MSVLHILSLAFTFNYPENKHTQSRLDGPGPVGMSDDEGREVWTIKTDDVH